MALGKWFNRLQYLIAKADATLSKVKDNSVIAHIMAKNGIVANFDDLTDSLEAIRDRIDVLLGGAAIQLRTEQSVSGPVEEDSRQEFAISLIDIDTGAVALGSIDISSISAVMEKSTGGGAFSDGGITQPTFAKAAGLVSDEYRFLASEWAVGDVYKLTVSGITATVGGDTAYVKAMVWSNIIHEVAEMKSDIDNIDSKIGTAADNGDLATVFAKLRQQQSGTQIHVLLIVNDAASLDADLDTALKDELEDQGFTVIVADPADIAGNLELTYDFIVVSGSITSDTNLALLREADCPVIVHSAEVAISTSVFSLGATAGVEAAQVDVEIVDNSIEWVIDRALGDLTLTASAEIETMASVSGGTISVAEEKIATGNDITMAVLKQGVADGSGVLHNFDRYFIGIKNFTLANSTFKAIMTDLWRHVIQEVRFGEVVVTPRRVFQEQVPDTGFSLAAVDTALSADPPSADAANSIVDIDKKTNRTFVLRSLFANVTGLGGGTNTITLQLWIDIGGTPTSVDSTDITAIGYYNLMDIFALPEVHADSIHITAKVNAGTGAISGIYRFAEAKK